VEEDDEEERKGSESRESTHEHSRAGFDRAEKRMNDREAPPIVDTSAVVADDVVDDGRVRRDNGEWRRRRRTKGKEGSSPTTTAMEIGARDEGEIGVCRREIAARPLDLA